MLEKTLITLSAAVGVLASIRRRMLRGMIRHPLWFAPGFGVAFFSAWMVIALATGEDPLPWGLAGGAAGAVTVAIWIRTGYVVSLHKARKNERHQ